VIKYRFFIAAFLCSLFPFVAKAQIPYIQSANDSLPEDFPAIRIVQSDSPSPGNLYFADFSYIDKRYGAYLGVMDNKANVLLYRNMYPKWGYNFQPQKGGSYTYFDAYTTANYETDSTLRRITKYEAANGYVSDFHEFIKLPHGGYALLAWYPGQVDLRSVGGDSNATVTFYAFQEFDSLKRLIFQWRTADSGHFTYTDATHEDLNSTEVDYVHANSIDFDPRDSTFILSSRSLDEITKISRKDGSIIWRMGGKHNQFTLLNDTIPFSHQHHVRLLPNGHITLFDNGNFRNTKEQFSRAIEYEVDEKAKTLRKVWEFRHQPDVYSSAMGSVQRLSNGNTLIGWGLNDSVAITEVTPSGHVALEIRFPLYYYSYRVTKFTSDQLSEVSYDPQKPITLFQNFPNPFSSSSVISFTVTDRNAIKLDVFDPLGRLVKSLFDGIVEPGEYSAKFEAGNLPSGIYICKLTTSSGSFSKSMILAK
jgi:hypothetical protein